MFWRLRYWSRFKWSMNIQALYDASVYYGFLEYLGMRTFNFHHIHLRQVTRKHLRHIATQATHRELPIRAQAERQKQPLPQRQAANRSGDHEVARETFAKREP